MTIRNIEPAVPMYSVVRLDPLTGEHFVDAFAVSPQEQETLRLMKQYAKNYPTLQAASPVIWGPQGQVVALVAVNFLKWSE